MRPEILQLIRNVYLKLEDHESIMDLPKRRRNTRERLLARLSTR